MNYQINEENLQTETMGNTPTMGVWKRLIGMITKPSEVFADIARQPNIGKALTVIIILNLIFTLISLPYILDFTKKIMPSNIPQGITGAVIGGAFFGAIIGLPIVLVIASTVYKVIFMITGEDGDFAKIFAVNLYAQIPVVLGTLIK